MHVTSSSSARFGRIAGRALARYIRMVRATSKLTLDPPDLYDRLEAEAPCIYAFWHGQFVLMPALQGDRGKARIMVARHGDAEIIAEVLRSFGSDLIRGAGSGGRRKDRGGSQALRAALRTLAEGHSVAMTADVPPGPARIAGSGIVTLARLSGRPIVPMAVASSRFLALDTWSRMTVNLPWSRLAGVAGAPIRVSRAATEEQLEEARKAVETALDDVTRRAYALAGGDITRATPAAALARSVGPPPPGARLAVYRAATRALTPALGMLLAYRRARGKEDPARVAERMGRAALPRPPGRLVWLHAASVGETLAILPVIGGLARRVPDLRFLLTTGTVTSARIAAERIGPETIHQYAPLDAPAFVRSFLDHWHPDLGIFTESDVWPNLILGSAERGIPLALINARMSNRSFGRWRRNKAMARPLFGRFRVVLAQNERLARRFAELGALDSRPAGNLKIDAPPPPVDAEKLAALRTAVGGRRVWLAASTHPGEEAMIFVAHRLLRALWPDLLTLVAPRHADRGPAIASEAEAAGLAVVRRSLGDMPGAATDIYLADTMGELGTLYALCPVAFVGGSLVPHGGQNPIEAVRSGTVVVTGPHTGNFDDAYTTLRTAHAAVLVPDAGDLAATVAALLSPEGDLAERRSAGERALAELAGACDRTVDALLDLLEEKATARRAD